MSEDNPVTTLTLVRTSVSSTIRDTAHCEITLLFEAPDYPSAKAIASRLDGLQVSVNGGIHEEAIDTLTAEIAALKAKHEEEIETHLRAATIQNQELIRLREMAVQLDHLMGVLK